MSVSRTEPTQRRAPVARSSGAPGPEVARRIDRFVSSFTAPSASARESAIHELRAGAAPLPGPYDPGGELLDAFRRELAPGGRLERSAEAHLAAAHCLAGRQRSGEATERLWSAIRLAETAALGGRPAERERARFVNREAGRLFSALGDAYQATARYEISRYYSVTADRRLRSLAVFRAEPRAGEHETSPRRVPEMGVRREPVAAPESVGRRAAPPDPPVPPPMEGRPVPGMSALDLANQIGCYARLLKSGPVIADYLRRRANAAYRRDLLPPPPRPSEIRALERAVRDGLAMPDGTRERAVAEAVRGSVDLYYMRDAARAFWGEP